MKVSGTYIYWLLAALSLLLSACGSRSGVIPSPAGSTARGVELGELVVTDGDGLDVETVERVLAEKLEGSFIVLESTDEHPQHAPQESNGRYIGVNYERRVLHTKLRPVSQNTPELVVSLPVGIGPLGDESNLYFLELSADFDPAILSQPDQNLEIQWRARSVGINFPGRFWSAEFTQQVRIGNLADWQEAHPAEAAPSYVSVNLYSISPDTELPVQSGSPADSAEFWRLQNLLNSSPRGWLPRFSRNADGSYSLQEAVPAAVQTLILSSYRHPEDLYTLQESYRVSITQLEPAPLAAAWQQLSPFENCPWPPQLGQSYMLRPEVLDKRQSFQFQLPAVRIESRKGEASFSDEASVCRLSLLYSWEKPADADLQQWREWHGGPLQAAPSEHLSQEELAWLLQNIAPRHFAVLRSEASILPLPLGTPTGPNTQVPSSGTRTGSNVANMHLEALLADDEQYEMQRNSSQLILRLERDDSAAMHIAAAYPLHILMPDGEYLQIDSMRAALEAGTFDRAVDNPAARDTEPLATDVAALPLLWQIEGSWHGAPFEITASQISWMSL